MFRPHVGGGGGCAGFHSQQSTDKIPPGADTGCPACEQPGWAAAPYCSREQKDSAGSSLPQGQSHFSYTSNPCSLWKMPHHSLLDASANTGPLLSMHRGTWARGSVPRPGCSGSLAPLPLSQGQHPPQCLRLLAQVCSNSCSQ